MFLILCNFFVTNSSICCAMNIIIKNINSEYFQNKANFIYAYILYSRNLDGINVKFWFFLLNRAENFRMVDIEISAWSSHFLNIKTNIILYLYPEKSIQPIRVAYMKLIKLKFCAAFKINIQKREGLSNCKEPVFDFSLLYPRKNGYSVIGIKDISL